MNNYLYLENYNNIVNLGISKKVFITIGEGALKTISELKTLLNDIKVDVVLRSTKVIYKIDIKSNTNLNEKHLIEEINSSVVNNLLTFCDAVPFDVDVRFIKSKKVEQHKNER